MDGTARIYIGEVVIPLFRMKDWEAYVLLQSSGDIYRAEYSRKDLDVMPIFRDRLVWTQFIGKEEMITKNLYPYRHSLEEMVLHCTRETLLAIDAWQ
jgi:hypothetical protein